jgi:hypothetical protein
MRVGAFLAVFGTVFIVLIALVRFPYGPQPLPGAARVPRDMPARCLTLAYNYEQDVESLPSQLRLRADTLPNPGWFAADDGSPGVLARYVGWRPAGSDSIDIAWHHSPIVRLPWPLRHPGDSLVGRMAFAGYTTLLFQGPQFSYRVVARPARCAGIFEEPPNESLQKTEAQHPAPA